LTLDSTGVIKFTGDHPTNYVELNGRKVRWAGLIGRDPWFPSPQFINYVKESNFPHISLQGVVKSVESCFHHFRCLVKMSKMKKIL